ncbi:MULTISPECIES: hypothetical protein [unclassified Variovorax]|uniref:hypothetical protein n=1 Tax=unclassified Variovorax TaxID=663243 RepID=UPI003F46E7B4
MKSVKLTGWKVGLKKISLAKVIQDALGGSIFDAKKIVEKVLQGEIISLEIPNEVFEDFIKYAQQAGVVLEVF